MPGAYAGGYGLGTPSFPSWAGGGTSTPTRVSPPSRAPSASTYQPPASVPQMPYQPEAPRATGIIQSLQHAGEGLLDPTSGYAQRLREEVTKGIGEQGAARKRAAMLAAIRGGMGSGASPELLDIEGEIGRGTSEAMGEAGAQLGLAAPQIGASMLSPALSGEIGLQGQRLSAFMNQQALAAQQEQDRIRNQQEADRLATDAMLRELSLAGGLF